MDRPVLKKVTNLTKNKWANMYTYEYEYDNKKIIYYVASRRKMNVHNANKFITDSVVALPYIIEDKEVKVVFIKQFRYAVNNFIYDLPAGLIEDGENPEVCARREVSEEVGGTVLKLDPCTSLSFTTPGCLNETSVTYFAKVKLNKRQSLQGDEIIELCVVPLNKILDFVDKNIMGVQGKMMAKIFYYQQKLKEAKNNKKKKTL